MVPRGIEHLDGEWLVLMWYAATEILDGGGLVLMWCAATDVRLEWVLVESSV